LETEKRPRTLGVLREAKSAVSVDEAAQALGQTNAATAKMLARWAQQNWLYRVRRVYFVW